MKKKIILSIAVGLGILGMMASCGGNKSKLEGVTPSEDTIQPAPEAETPVNDTIIPAPAESETSAMSEAPAEERKKASSKGELNIKITPGKMKTKDVEGWEAFYGIMTITLTNLSDSPVSGKDYYIAYKCKEDDGTSENLQEYTTNLKAKGINLAPGASGHINLKRLSAHKFYDFKVKSK